MTQSMDLTLASLDPRQVTYPDRRKPVDCQVGDTPCPFQISAWTMSVSGNYLRDNILLACRFW
jgi:hypothetical protein